MFKKILVALDDSAMSQSVFEQALELAKVMNATLMLNHVLMLVDDGFADYPMGVDAFYPRLHEDVVKRHLDTLGRIEKEGLERLKRLTDQATAQGVRTEFTQSVGDPGSRICALARTWEAELIVVGRRGRTGLSEWFLGSVSNYVLHHAPCSVLTVQGEEVADSMEEAEAAAAAAG